MPYLAAWRRTPPRPARIGRPNPGRKPGLVTRIGRPILVGQSWPRQNDDQSWQAARIGRPILVLRNLILAATRIGDQDWSTNPGRDQSWPANPGQRGSTNPDLGEVNPGSDQDWRPGLVVTTNPGRQSSKGLPFIVGAKKKKNAKALPLTFSQCLA